MYKQSRAVKSRIKSIDKFEGELIETKVTRLTKNNEPIKDGAPLIYTDRKDGIIAAHNIRTDRFEIAAEKMDIVHKTNAAKSQPKAEMKAEKGGTQDDKSKGEESTPKGDSIGGAESKQGTES